MKNRKRVFLIMGFVLLVLANVSLISYCRDRGRLNSLLRTEDAMEKLRGQRVSPEIYKTFQKWTEKPKQKEDAFSFYDYLLSYLLTGEEERKPLQWQVQRLKAYKKEQYREYIGYLQAVWEDLKYFPVPVSTLNESAQISYYNSWMAPRTFGGQRGHEGTDLMARINERGRYPVLSMTDGVVEQIGWLTKGGYRIGIRAPHGGYFYYAHLYDYAREFQIGEPVRAGELLGFMGDSGYSKIEGTVGNFDVHLHVGIYVEQPDGGEVSVNAFWPLTFLEERKLAYPFY